MVLVATAPMLKWLRCTVLLLAGRSVVTYRLELGVKCVTLALGWILVILLLLKLYVSRLPASTAAHFSGSGLFWLVTLLIFSRWSCGQ